MNRNAAIALIPVHVQPLDALSSSSKKYAFSSIKNEDWAANRVLARVFETKSKFCRVQLSQARSPASPGDCPTGASSSPPQPLRPPSGPSCARWWRPTKCPNNGNPHAALPPLLSTPCFSATPTSLSPPTSAGSRRLGGRPHGSGPLWPNLAPVARGLVGGCGGGGLPTGA